MTAENNEMKNKNQEMDEHQKLTLDIFECYQKSDFKGMKGIMAQVTPKVKEEIIIYIDQIINI